MFISFYITDSKYSLVFQYLLSSNSPPFAHLWSKVQDVCPELANDDVANRNWEAKDDMGNLKSVCGSVSKNLELYKYYSSKNKLYYFCLTSGSGSTSSISPFVFLESMDRSLLEYFDKDRLTVNKITNNYDRITMIFYVCVNGGGPAAGRLYGNRIKKVVPARSDLSKIINSTAHGLQVAVQRQGQQHNQTFVSDSLNRLENDTSSREDDVVPWRTAGLKYSNNELYVDLTESIHVVYQKAGKRSRRTSSKLEMICGTINGQASVKCYLSGNPTVDLQLDLAGNDLGVPAFHECVELDNHQNPSNCDLRFIPPDGRFNLMQYSIDLDTPRIQQTRRFNHTVGLVTIDFADQLGNKTDEFEITVNISNSREVANIEDLRIDVQLQSNTDEDSETDFKIKVLRNTHGRFDNSVVPGQGSWIFDKDTPTGTLPVLRGCVESTEPRLLRVQRVTASYSQSGQLASGIRVKAINIGQLTTKSNRPFKGVKYATKTGDFEIRS